MPATLSQRDVLFADPTDQRLASQLLHDLDGSDRPITFEAKATRAVAVPAELAHIMARVIEILASGDTLTIGSLPQELTTTVAAEQLGVSRPTLMKMIRDGEMPARKVGSHHRVKTSDVLAAKRAKLERQARSFDELRALEEKLAAN